MSNKAKITWFIIGILLVGIVVGIVGKNILTKYVTVHPENIGQVIYFGARHANFPDLDADRNRRYTVLVDNNIMAGMADGTYSLETFINSGDTQTTIKNLGTYVGKTPDYSSLPEDPKTPVTIAQITPCFKSLGLIVSQLEELGLMSDEAAATYVTRETVSEMALQTIADNGKK